jgi:transcriptional regulator with XRE-family HTH domain
MQRESDVFFERLGKAIKVERTRQGLRQDDLAVAAGLSKPYVSHIEVGRRHPSMDAVSGIAQALGLSVGQLMLAAEPGRGAAIVAGVGQHGAMALSASSSIRRGVVSRHEAEAALGDLDRAQTLADQSIARVIDSAPQDRSLLEDVRHLGALAVAYASGNYRGCPREDAVLVLAALAYLATPLDQMPDWLGEAGLHDDLGVLAFTLGLAGPSIEDFRVWVLAQHLASED